MKKAWTFGLALLLCGAIACAQGKTYVFPENGLRYTVQEDELVLTRTNLKEHTELLTALGTSPEAMLSDFCARGVLMELLPESGGQLEISEVSAGDARSAAELAEALSAAGLYETCEAMATDPESVRVTASAMAGSMPVYSLAYLTVNGSHAYRLSLTLVGREPDEADDAVLVGLLSELRFFEPVAAVTPEPTAVPTPVPTSTPEPDSSEAVLLSSTGNMILESVPAVTTENTLSLRGKTDPSETVRAAVNGQTVTQVNAASDGTFRINVPLSAPGDMTLAIMTGTAECIYSIRYEVARVGLTITEPASPVYTGSYCVVRGKTQPDAVVYVNGKGNNVNVKANRLGEFTVRIMTSRAGTETYTLRAHLRGYEDSTTELTLTREMTAREKQEEFRRTMAAVSYDQLSANPSRYTGTKCSFKGYVIDFMDYNGSPCALVCNANPATGVFGDPMWIVLAQGQDVQVSTSVTFYVTGEGFSLPACSTYTRNQNGTYIGSGAECEAPVLRQVTFD